MPVKSQQGFDWATMTIDQVARMNSIGGRAVETMARSAESYLQGVVNLSQEVTGFMTARLLHDLELGRSLATCGSFADAAKAQQAWSQRAGEDYLAEGQKMAELGSRTVMANWARFYSTAGEPDAEEL